MYIRDSEGLHEQKDMLEEVDEKVTQEVAEEAERYRSILVDEEYISPYDESMAFARLLYIARVQSGLSVEEAFTEMGFSRRRYLLLEAGEKVPWQRSELKKICRVLGIDPILAEKQRQRSLDGLRRLGILYEKGRKQTGPVNRLNKMSVAVPARVYRWLKTEANLRNLGISGFAGLLLAMNYRMYMREVTGELEELEQSFDTAYSKTGVAQVIYDDEETEEEYITKPDGDYEWSRDADDDEEGDLQ